jgi:hypothetical protein
MRMSCRSFVFALLLGLTACKGFPFFWKTELIQTDAHESSARLRVELQDIHYDGWTLSGRLLVSPEEGRVRMDKRLIESTALTMKSVTECSTGQPVEFMVLDVAAKPPQEEDVLVLKPGYWYGKEIRVPLVAESPDKRRGPECIDADLIFTTLDKVTALLHVRAQSPSRHPAKAELPPAVSLPQEAGP